MKKHGSILLMSALLAAGWLWSQGPPLRWHTVNRAGKLRLVKATENPPAPSKVETKVEGEQKKIQSNGIPNHQVGAFPNRGNPNTIREQSHVIDLPAHPAPAAQITFMHALPPGPQVFGITLDGVLIEPGAAEVWQGNRYWQYEPLGAAIDLGLDENYAHVQPTGMYHYHGLPTGLMKRLGFKEGAHSPLIGWAADGFPVYVRYGYRDPKDPASGIVDLQPGYQLMEGNRPGGSEGPGGSYDGAFIRDYDWKAGSGDLDECSGRFCVTPDFPEGTYAYFLTEKWPVIPRAFRGTPVDIKKQLPSLPPGGKGKGKGKGKGGPFPPP